MNRSASPNQRRKQFVDNHVQGALIKRILFHWLSLFLVLGVAMLGFKTLLADPGISPTDRFAQAKGDFLLVAILMFALLPVFILDTIRFSNRFVGPIARFRQGLRDLAEGKNVRLQFRKGDFWHEMASELNAVSQLLDDTVAGNRGRNDGGQELETRSDTNELATCGSGQSGETVGAQQ